MWEIFRDNFGPSFTLWYVARRGAARALDKDMTAYFEAIAQTTGSASIVVTGVPRACAT